MPAALRRRTRLKTCAKARACTLEGASPLVLYGSGVESTPFAFAAPRPKTRGARQAAVLGDCPRPALFCNDPWLEPQARVCSAPRRHHSISVDVCQTIVRFFHEPAPINRAFGNGTAGEEAQDLKQTAVCDICCTLSIAWGRCTISKVWVCAISQRLLILLKWHDHNDLYAFGWLDRRLVLLRQFGRMRDPVFFPETGCLLYVAPNADAGIRLVIARVTGVDAYESSAAPLAFGLHLSAWPRNLRLKSSHFCAVFTPPRLTIMQLGVPELTLRGNYTSVSEHDARNLAPRPFVQLELEAVFDSALAASRVSASTVTLVRNPGGSRANPYEDIHFFSDQGVPNPAILHGWRCSSTLDYIEGTEHFDVQCEVLKHRQELRVDVCTMPSTLSTSFVWLLVCDRDLISCSDYSTLPLFECRVSELSAAPLAVLGVDSAAAAFCVVKQCTPVTSVGRVLHFAGSRWAASVRRVDAFVDTPLPCESLEGATTHARSRKGVSIEFLPLDVDERDSIRKAGESKLEECTRTHPLFVETRDMSDDYCMYGDGEFISGALNAFGDVAVIYRTVDWCLGVLAIRQSVTPADHGRAHLKIPLGGHLNERTDTLRAHHTEDGTFICVNVLSDLREHPAMISNFQLMVQVLPELRVAGLTRWPAWLGFNSCVVVGPRLGNVKDERELMCIRRGLNTKHFKAKASKHWHHRLALDVDAWLYRLGPHIGSDLAPLVLQFFSIEDVIASYAPL